MTILSTWLCPSTTTWSKPSDAECWSLALFVPVLNAYDRAICLVFFVAGDMARIADMVYVRWSWNLFLFGPGAGPWPSASVLYLESIRVRDA